MCTTNILQLGKPSVYITRHGGDPGQGETRKGRGKVIVNIDVRSR